MDVLDGQIGIVVTNDLTERNVFIDQFQDVLDRDTCARNTWFAEVNSWINGYSVHVMPSAFSCRSLIDS